MRMKTSNSLITTNSDWTMFLVIKNTDNVAISKYDGGTNKLLWIGTSTTFKFTIRDSEADALDVITTESVADWKVITITYDNTTKTVTVYINGLTFTATNASYSNDGWNTLYLFLNGQGNGTAPTTYGTGTGIAEWFITTDKKSTSDINGIAGYLADKFGLTWTNI
jgi:VCBS repeat-containing protein